MRKCVLYGAGGGIEVLDMSGKDFIDRFIDESREGNIDGIPII